MCEQCIRLDIHGPKNRLRQHQQVRDVMVHVSRNELRPFWLLTNLGSKGWNHLKDVLVIHRNLGRPSIPQVHKLFREAKVSDEATEALKHFSCDALSARTGVSRILALFLPMK